MTHAEGFDVDDARDRMIDGTIQLLATRGLQATSFAEVIKLTDTPRGSIYHHFPNGKDQLVGEAIERAAQRALGFLEATAGSSAHEVAAQFIGLWRALLVHTDQRAGCSVLAVTVASDSAALAEHVGLIFRSWQSRLAELLAEGGVPTADAAALATTLIAGCEGAVVLSRAERSIEPFDRVASVLLGLVPAAPAKKGARRRS